jgi:hypothetical protein
MRITSQQNCNTLARNRRNPYSRVLRGPHLSDALRLLVQRLARNSGLNHRHGKGKSFVARRCVLSVPLWTPVPSLVQPPVASPQRFSTEFTASTEKEKRSKKEREAATTANRFTSHYRALNTYKGKCVSAPPWVEVTSELTPLPRPAVFRSGETRSQGGGRGEKGSGG